MTCFGQFPGKNVSKDDLFQRLRSLDGVLSFFEQVGKDLQ